MAVHNLSLVEATRLLSMGGESECSPIVRQAQVASDSSSDADDDKELIWFDSWYKDLDPHLQKTLPPKLKNPARNLIRRRGLRTHLVPRGKCRRIAEEIKVALMHAKGDAVEASVCSDGSSMPEDLEQNGSNIVADAEHALQRPREIAPCCGALELREQKVQFMCDAEAFCRLLETW